MSVFKSGDLNYLVYVLLDSKFLMNLDIGWFKNSSMFLHIDSLLFILIINSFNFDNNSKGTILDNLIDYFEFLPNNTSLHTFIINFFFSEYLVFTLLYSSNNYLLNANGFTCSFAPKRLLQFHVPI